MIKYFLIETREDFIVETWTNNYHFGYEFEGLINGSLKVCNRLE